MLVATAAPALAGESGVEPKAGQFFRQGPLQWVTNSMVTSWVVAIIFIIAVRLIIRKPKLVPSRGQAVVENLVEGVRGLISPIVGAKVASHAFPLLISLFTFILIQNWSGLFPGVGTVYVQRHGDWMEFVRPGNADMNATIALALVAFVAWFYFVMRYAGPMF
ncbi:MAG: F0F1 ATP synthase subunit A, partial [Opitutaceae bacterium]